jgi:hypothetical protein
MHYTAKQGFHMTVKDLAAGSAAAAPEPGKKLPRWELQAAAA